VSLVTNHLYFREGVTNKASLWSFADKIGTVNIFFFFLKMSKQLKPPARMSGRASYLEIGCKVFVPSQARRRRFVCVVVVVVGCCWLLLLLLLVAVAASGAKAGRFMR